MTATMPSKAPAWLNIEHVAPPDFLERVEAAASAVDAAGCALRDVLPQAVAVLREWNERVPDFDDAEEVLAEQGIDGPFQLRQLLYLIGDAVECARNVGVGCHKSHEWHGAQ